jgi:hypothetical protein
MNAERTFPIPLKGRPGPHAFMPTSTASNVVFTRSLPWSSYNGNILPVLTLKNETEKGSCTYDVAYQESFGCITVVAI